MRDPHDVLATPDGRLIVADTGNNRVVELDSNGGWLSTFPSPAAARDGWRLADPHNVTLDASGRLLISDTGHDRVVMLERRAGLITELRHLTLPHGDLSEGRGCPSVRPLLHLDSGTPRVISPMRAIGSWVAGDGAGGQSAQVLRPPRWMTVTRRGGSC